MGVLVADGVQVMVGEGGMGVIVLVGDGGTKGSGADRSCNR